MGRAIRGAVLVTIGRYCSRCRCGLFVPERGAVVVMLFDWDAFGLGLGLGFAAVMVGWFLSAPIRLFRSVVVSETEDV
jgi:hypothetical protein